jgi:hypothetical protein
MEKLISFFIIITAIISIASISFSAGDDFKYLTQNSNGTYLYAEIPNPGSQWKKVVIRNISSPDWRRTEYFPALRADEEIYQSDILFDFDCHNSRIRPIKEINYPNRSGAKPGSENVQFYHPENTNHRYEWRNFESGGGSVIDLCAQRICK